MRAPHKPRSLPRLAPLLVLALLFLFAPTARGQSTDGGQIPDGSSDEGDIPEGEDSTGRVQTDCRVTDRCPPAFSCVQGTCEWTGITEAEGPSCALGSSLGALLAFGVLFQQRRR